MSYGIIKLAMGRLAETGQVRYATKKTAAAKKRRASLGRFLLKLKEPVTTEEAVKRLARLYGKFKEPAKSLREDLQQMPEKGS